MKTKASLLILISVLIAGLTIPYNLTAQQVTTGEISKMYQVTLKDGSTLTGKLVSQSEKEIVIQSETLGEMKVQRENIKSMTLISAINNKASGIWFENPNASRYLLSSSAIPMEKKTGYYQNTWIFVNSFGYAFTRNLSLSAGFEIFSIMAGGEGPYAFYLNPKASFKVAKNLYLGGTILYANTIRTVDEFGGLATLNGSFTYGNKNNNITATIGWGSSDGEFSAQPLITISGMARVSKRIGLISENWMLPNAGDDGGYYGVYSYGIRFLGEKISVDLAFLNNADIASEIIIGIPWLDFVVNF
jgi:hypothetical protein